MYITSILLPCSAAMAVPQLTSTGSNLTLSAAAIALPIETPRPEFHSPLFGSFENHGGACVTPTRSTPRCLICESVLSPDACGHALDAHVASPRTRTARRWMWVGMALRAAQRGLDDRSPRRRLSSSMHARMEWRVLRLRPQRCG